VGAFEYFIDLPAVLDAAAALPTVQFLLVGAGRWLAWLEREVLRRRLRNCELTGPVPYDRVPGLIAQMDVCLCPYRLMPVSHAASPLKFFEYLALSRIVVASRTEELLRVGRSACLFADGAPEIVQTLRGLLDGRTDWEPLVREGARLVLRDHNWDRLCADMLQAIEARL
jgi:glycosyltransferase involved in cell wall biosynthesis